MVGYLVWRERGWRIRYFEEELYHVPLWRVELPKNNHPDRTIQRALTTLRRHGVTRLLTDDAPLLPPVATGPLWRALAGQAALVELARRRIPPGQAFVGLRAKQADRSVVACCTALAPGGAWAGVGDTGLRGVGVELAAAVWVTDFGTWGRSHRKFHRSWCRDRSFRQHAPPARTHPVLPWRTAAGGLSARGRSGLSGGARGGALAGCAGGGYCLSFDRPRAIMDYIPF